MANIYCLRKYLRKYKKEIVFGTITVFFANVFSLLIPEFMKYAVDGIRTGMPYRKLYFFVFAILGAALVQGFFRFLSRYFLIGMSRRVEYDIRKDIFSHMQRLPISYFKKNKTGDIMSRLTNELEDVRMMVGPGVMYTVNTAIILTAAGYMMFRISPTLALYSMTSFVLFVFYIKATSSKLFKRFREMRENTAKTTAFLQEYFSGIALFKVYCQEDEQKKKFLRVSEEYLESNMRLIKVLGSFMPSIGFISGLGSLVVLYFGGLDLMLGKISLGDFVAFGVYLGLLISPVVGLGWAASLIQRGKASLSSLNTVFEEEVEDKGEQAANVADVKDGSIRFENVSFKYESGEFELSEISFDLPKGSMLAIVGPVGSGKSTLAKLIPRLMDPLSGNIYIGGVKHKDISLKNLRNSIGFVPQESFLYSESIRQNITMDIELEEEELNDLVIFSQLKHEIHEFPEKLDTMLGERGVNLSGGQKQRLTLARAIAARPKILILDDAFSSVDVNTEKKIIERFKHLVKDITSLVVSHRLTGVIEANHILVLSHGKIVEDGTHESLIKENGLYAKMFRMQEIEEKLI